MFDIDIDFFSDKELVLSIDNYGIRVVYEEWRLRKNFSFSTWYQFYPRRLGLTNCRDTCIPKNDLLNANHLVSASTRG